jgi:hypothetical protein
MIPVLTSRSKEVILRPPNNRAGAVISSNPVSLEFETKSHFRIAATWASQSLQEQACLACQSI